MNKRTLQLLMILQRKTLMKNSMLNRIKMSYSMSWIEILNQRKSSKINKLKTMKSRKKKRNNRKKNAKPWLLMSLTRLLKKSKNPRRTKTKLKKRSLRLHRLTKARKLAMRKTKRSFQRRKERSLWLRKWQH